MGTKGLVFILLFFPAIYVILLVSDLLVVVYNPFVRIGVIVLISILYLSYSFRKKYTKRQNDYLENLSLQSGKIEGTEYFFTTEHNQKAKITTINTYIEGVYGYDFSLKFEGKIDRFFKSIGFSTECQSGDTRFDETIYIVSDNMWLCDQLQTNHKLRDLFYELFWCYHEQNVKVNSIRCFDGRILIVSQYSSQEHDEKLMREYARSVASLLQNTLLHLPSKGSIDDAMYREPTGYAAHVFFVIILAMLANGAIVLLADMTTVQIMPHLVHSFSIVPLAIKIALVFLAVLMAAAFFFLRRSSRLSPVITQITTLGALGIVLTSVVEIKELNTRLDTSPATVYESQITGKEAVHHRKRGTTYHLHLRSWDNLNNTFNLVVPYSLYAKSNEGDSARIYEHKGYLGYPWIENINVFPLPRNTRQENQESERQNTLSSSENNVNTDRAYTQVKRLYGDQLNGLDDGEKEYIVSNFKLMRRITQEELNRYGSTQIPPDLHINDSNLIEFYLHPDGSISDINFIKKSKEELLNKITRETIQLASKKYTHPKQKTLIRYRINYQLGES